MSRATANGNAWSLSIRPVGAEHQATQQEGNSSYCFTGKDFTVEVCPEDDLTSLYDRIEGVTGLKASQQRLIYRGRLIGAQHNNKNINNKQHSGSSSLSVSALDSTPTTTSSAKSDDDMTSDKGAIKAKIKDIAGLCDGQTIHLMRRREQPGDETAVSPDRSSSTTVAGQESTSTAVSSDTPLRRGRDRGESNDGGENGEALGSSAAPLLAALLGLGESSSENNGNNNANDRGGENPRRWRSSRYGGATSGLRGLSGSSVSSRRAHHRLTADDLEGADPGSMEGVRQGMMTLHSMLPHAQAMASATQNDELRNPTDTNRRWYVGQWVDCLDTVNQWLEATISEIVYPDDILPPPGGGSGSSSGDDEDDSAVDARTLTIRALDDSLSARQRPPPTRSSSLFAEPVVTAGDLDGRRRLLIEPCEQGDEGDLGGDLTGYRRREDDHDVQLLLVHYNGWPHRWDEWIRSDSDRIRPFRVRTRHPNTSSNASPTPQSIFPEAPPTYISFNATDSDNSNSESIDRAALLPELSRVLSHVNQLLRNAAASSSVSNASSFTALDTESVDRRSTHTSHNLPWRAHQLPGNVDENENSCDNSPLPATTSTSDAVSSRRLACRRRELEALAPLLDRLGRTLIDSAPHVSAYARSLSDNNARGANQDQPPELETIEEHPTSLGGLLSLLSRDRRRQSNASSNVVVGGTNDSASNASAQTNSTTADDETTSIDPDLTDFASGVVNTTRGDVRRGPRSSLSQGEDTAAGLLGAYLAAASLGGMQSIGGGNDNDQNNGAASLGRLLRDRGAGGGGGIDIHIHAVVTAPGISPGGLGLATFGGTTPAGLGTPIAVPVPDTPSTPNTLFSAVNGRGFGNRGNSNRQHQGSRPNRVPVDDDDMGIFAELYSENPDPVDPNGTPFSQGTLASVSTPDRNHERETASSLSASSSSSRDQSPNAPSRAISFSASSNRSNRSLSRNSRRSNSSRGDIDRSGASSSRRIGGGGMFGRLFSRRNESPGDN